MGTKAGLYDTDFYAWVQDQAALLAARRFEELDLPHLVEELQLMGSSERGELANRLSVLLAHLLKLQIAAKRLPISMTALSAAGTSPAQSSGYISSGCCAATPVCALPYQTNSPMPMPLPGFRRR